MTLMIPIEDAKRVLRKYDYLLDDHVGEILTNAMEQKSIVIDQEDQGWEDVIRQHVEEVTDPKKIWEHAKDGTLDKWIGTYRNDILNELKLALEYKHRTHITETDTPPEPVLSEEELHSVRELMVSLYEYMIGHLNENELEKCMEFLVLQTKRMSTAIT